MKALILALALALAASPAIAQDEPDARLARLAQNVNVGSGMVLDVCMERDDPAACIEEELLTVCGPGDWGDHPNLRCPVSFARSDDPCLTAYSQATDFEFYSDDFPHGTPPGCPDPRAGR